MRLIKNRETGNVFGWTEILAKSPNMVEVFEETAPVAVEKKEKKTRKPTTVVSETTEV